MSTVFYRWGAGRDESRVTFDGTHISVFDLKREIILNNKMGNGKDFDLGIFDNVTGEEFKDDHHQIPRSSSLIARRLPASAKGRGNAQHYIAGTTAADALANEHRIEAHARQGLLQKQDRLARGPGGGGFGSMSKRFDGKDDKKSEPAVQISTGDADEDAKIQAMFAANADQWEQMQEDMSSRPNAAVHRARAKAAPAKAKFDYSMNMEKEPPVGYICYRCGQKGHWIQDCPTGDDPAAVEKKRFVRVTGIPRSFLKTVETPGSEGSSQGAMLTADGGFVQAMPDKRLWQKLAGAKPRTLTNAEVRDQQPLDDSITCAICKKLVWEAVRVPCCKSAFCEECIQNYLLEHDFECPVCESKVPSLDALSADQELRDKVKGYIEGEIERSKREEKEERENKGQEGGDLDDSGRERDGKMGDDSTGPTSESNGEPAPLIDRAKMQEMMNPKTMQLYLSQVAKMMQNPRITSEGKSILQAQLQMVQSGMLQMQMMMMNGNGPNVNPGMGMQNGMNGFGNNNNGNNNNNNHNGNMMAGMGMPMNMMQMQMEAMGMPMMNMGGGMGMGMGMGMNMPMGMGMPMDMNMGMNMGMGMPMNGMGMNMGPGPGAGPGPGPGPGMGMGMGMGMNQNMGMMGNQNQNMNMNMNVNMNQGPNPNMNNHMGGGMMGPGRGRGMPFRGGFRGGRGGGGGGGGGPRSGIPIPTVRPPKRSGEEAELDGSGGIAEGGKMQRVM